MTDSFPGREKLTSLGGALSSRAKEVAALLVISMLSVGFFWRVLFTNEVLVGDNLSGYIPWNYYQDSGPHESINHDYSDTLLAYFPQILVARQILRSGNLPLWNPYSLSGVPFLASAPWLGFFYPPYVVFYVLDPLKAIGYLASLQLALGGLFMYLYLRSIGCRRLAAVMGAVSFELGGFLLANLAWLPRVSTVVWTPLIFLSLEKVIGNRSWLYVSLGSFATAMCILAGNMAVVIYVLLAAGLYCVFRLGQVLWREGVGTTLRIALVVLASISTGILVSAVQLAPTYEVAQFTERAHVSYEDRMESGRSPIALGTLLVPDLFGNPVDRPWGRNEFAKNVPGTYGETSLYVGIVPLFLAIWAIARRRDGFTAFFGCLALLSLLIFLDTPFFRLLYQLPLFRIGRQLEAKAMWGFAMAVLAALGVEALLNRPPHMEWRALRQAAVGLVVVPFVVLLGFALAGSFFVSHETGEASRLASEWYHYNAGNFVRLCVLAVACAGAVFVWARGWLRKWMLAVLVLWIALADLMCFGWKLNPTRPPDDLYPVMDSVRFLENDESLYRTIRGPLSRKVLPPNSLSVYGVSDVQGYSPVLIDYYVDFLQLIEEDIASSRIVYSLKYPRSTTSPLLDLLNAKYIITIATPGEEMTQLERSEPSLELVYDGEVKIYENRDVLPRAFFVPDYAVAEDGDEVLDLLVAEGFDPSALVILEKEPAPFSHGVADVAKESHVDILEYAPNRVTIEADLPADGFVVLTDLYFKGWRVFGDGMEQEVYRADYVFRAVQVGQGRHTIEFVFDPLSFKVGLGITLLALLLAGALLVGALLARKRAQSRAPLL
jgi:hypothetical protein